jgi:hypothetical protein
VLMAVTIASGTRAQPLPLAELVQAPTTQSGILLPAIHNSLDTHCSYQRQCTSEEFVELLETLRRQWALTPEWLRFRCLENSTYNTMESCILRQTTDWFGTHPHAQAPWINPDNFLPPSTK